LHPLRLKISETLRASGWETSKARQYKNRIDRANGAPSIDGLLIIEMFAEVSRSTIYDSSMRGKSRIKKSGTGLAARQIL
jgi:hypothetical protein